MLGRLNPHRIQTSIMAVSYTHLDVYKRQIGYMLAEKLGIPCYSREILQRASEESGINESMFNARDERDVYKRQ